ncbi:MAG: flagellar basal-body rod protein FlgF [candidate division Zixibacteria bacterium]|jgi:flagellar basal-body rod protein FlgG|nr:flagellar basal-body rod protein FlgF [candidate division Zixibacteria bacterium]
MLKGIRTSASGMIPRARKQEMIANNIANAATPGFKKDRLFTKELSRAQVKQARKVSKSDWEKPMVNRTYTDFQAGSFNHTGNPLDLAIDGDGFFQLQDTEGNVYLTRSGNFSIDNEGYVTFPGGYRLIGEGGPVQLGQGQVTVGADGEIDVDGLATDRIRAVDVADHSVLEKLGSSLYGVPEGEELLPALRGEIQQGYLEAANVDVVHEMVDMIITFREYEANAKSLQTQDESLDHLFRRVAGNE